MDNPYVRLAGRAITVALVSALTQINTATGDIVWRSVITGAVLAAVEFLTPLNPTVGIAKKTA